MKNKLINQKTHFPSWHAYNEAGAYVGRIEQDYNKNWWLVFKNGTKALMGSFAEARLEARDYLK